MPTQKTSWPIESFNGMSACSESPRELQTHAYLPLVDCPRPEAVVSLDKNAVAASMVGRSRLRPMRGKSQLKKINE
jgi:hypothetical protein